MLGERRRERVRSRISGFISELEPVEASDSPAPVHEPVSESHTAAEPETFQPLGNSAPDSTRADDNPDALVTDRNDSGQFRELAHVLRTGLTRAEAQRERRSARREARRLDRERGGYERYRDGVRISPAAFLRSELRGVSGMDYAAMLRRWKALGGTGETLEGAISAGPYRLKRERMDFNRYHVVPVASPARVERGAA